MFLWQMRRIVEKDIKYLEDLNFEEPGPEKNIQSSYTLRMCVCVRERVCDGGGRTVAFQKY